MSHITQELLQQAEIALANMTSYQSSGNSPTIHEYGQARRALDTVRAALAQPEPINAQLLDTALELRHALSNVLQQAPKEIWPKWLEVRDRADAVMRVARNGAQNMCENCAMDLTTCDCTVSKPVAVKREPAQPEPVNAMLVEALQAAEKLEHEALVALSEATYELKVGNTYTTATDTYKANNDLIHRLDKILNSQYRDRKRAALTAAKVAQPEPVSLTDEQIDSLWIDAKTGANATQRTARKFARAVLAAAKGGAV